MHHEFVYDLCWFDYLCTAAKVSIPTKSAVLKGPIAIPKDSNAAEKSELPRLKLIQLILTLYSKYINQGWIIAS